MTFDFIVILLVVEIFIFYQPIIMIFPQFVIYVLIDDYLKVRKDPSITSQGIANYISVALAVALSVFTFCLIVAKFHVIRYFETMYTVKYKIILSMKVCEVLSKLKCRGLRATSHQFVH